MLSVIEDSDCPEAERYWIFKVEHRGKVRLVFVGEMKGVVRWRRLSHVTVNSRIGVHRPNRSLSVKMVPLLSIATEHRFGMTRGMSKRCAVLFARHANVTPDCTVTGTADSRTVTQYLLGETDSKSGYRIE